MHAGRAYMSYLRPHCVDVVCLYQELPFFQVPSTDWALFFFFFEPGNGAYATVLRMLLVFLALLLLARGLFFLFSQARQFTSMYTRSEEVSSQHPESGKTDCEVHDWHYICDGILATGPFFIFGDCFSKPLGSEQKT